jgi:hypothetical protein
MLHCVVLQGLGERQPAESDKTQGKSLESLDFPGKRLSEGGGTRTHDQRIKSPLLYRLSYALDIGKTRLFAAFPLLSFASDARFDAPGY